MYLPVFLNNVIRQVDIMLIVASIKSCGSDISQFLNVVEKIIYWCIDIKSHLFDHTPVLGKHMRCDYSIYVEEIHDYDDGGSLDGFSIVIPQGSDVLHIDRCDDFFP